MKNTAATNLRIDIGHTPSNTKAVPKQLSVKPDSTGSSLHVEPGTGLFDSWTTPTKVTRPKPSVVIVGGGSRAIWAVDALRKASDEPLNVTVFEPTPWPGAGPIYAADQPGYLRMNFPASKIDVSEGKNPFLKWALTAGVSEPIEADSYVPRALVGRYLQEQFLWILYL